MAPRIKLIVHLLTLERIFETCAMFRPASAGLDHALVVACGLTKIPDEGLCIVLLIEIRLLEL